MYWDEGHTWFIWTEYFFSLFVFGFQTLLRPHRTSITSRILLSAHLSRERIRETRNGFSLLQILRSCTKVVSSHLIGDLLQTGVTATSDVHTFLPTCRLSHKILKSVAWKIRFLPGTCTVHT